METGARGTSLADDGDRAFAAGLRAALIQAAAAAVIAATAAPDRLLARLVEAAAAAVPSPAGALLLVDPAARLLRFEVVIGQSASQVANLTVPLGRGIAGLVAVSGQPLAIANAQQDPRHARDIAEQAGYLPTTILAVPVAAADGSVVGVLELLDRQEEPTFGLDDMALLGRFAELCAIALEQRRADVLHADLIGRALSGLAGLSPAARAALDGQAEAFAARVAADPVARRAGALAARVASVAAAGEAEQRACEDILGVFAAYLAAHPGPGSGMEMYVPGSAFATGRS